MAAINLTDLTSGAVSGSGVFDKLMQVTKLHLQQEFEAGRIKGTDYANVYLASLQAVMQQATSFLLQKQAADKQAELLVEQIANALAQNTTINKQNIKLDKEIALLAQKTLTEEAQILDTVNGVPVAGVIGEQKSLLVKQTEGFQRSAEQKILSTLANTWNIRHTADSGGNPGNATNGLSNENIKVAVNKALEGINTTPAA